MSQPECAALSRKKSYKNSRDSSGPKLALNYHEKIVSKFDRINQGVIIDETYILYPETQFEM